MTPALEALIPPALQPPRKPAPATGPFLEADARRGGRLSRALQAVLEADLDIAQAAAMLGIEARVVRARLRRVEMLTGRRLDRFHDVAEVLVAIDAARQAHTDRDPTRPQDPAERRDHAGRPRSHEDHHLGATVLAAPFRSQPA